MNKRSELLLRIHKFKIDSNQFRGAILKDLHRLYVNLANQAEELDKELVECRRIHKVTSHYETLENQLESMLDLAEQQLTFAALLDH